MHQTVNLASSEFGGSNPSLPIPCVSSFKFASLEFEVCELEVPVGRLDLRRETTELGTENDAGVAQR